MAQGQDAEAEDLRQGLLANDHAEEAPGPSGSDSETPAEATGNSGTLQIYLQATLAAMQIFRAGRLLN